MKQYTGWIIAVLAVTAIIYLQLCRTPKPIKTDDVYSALVKQTKDTVAYYEELLKANDAATELAVVKAEQAFQNQLQAENNLKVSNDQVSTLTAQLRTARKDTSKSVAVSPWYVRACDSLEFAADMQTLRAKMYIKSNDSLKHSLFLQETSYKNKLNIQAQFNNALRRQLDTCQLKVKETGARKRSQVYAGLNLMGNKTYFIDGGQVNLTLLTKRNTMFEVNGALIHGQLYVGGGTKFLLSFRRP